MYRRAPAQRAPSPPFSSPHVGHASSSSRSASSGTSASPVRRLLYGVGAVFGLFLFLHFVSPSRSSLSSMRNANLPGFGFKSSLSRRTDYHLRYDRKRKSAASKLASHNPLLVEPSILMMSLNFSNTRLLLPSFQFLRATSFHFLSDLFRGR